MVLQLQVNNLVFSTAEKETTEKCNIYFKQDTEDVHISTNGPFDSLLLPEKYLNPWYYITTGTQRCLKLLN